MNRAVIVTVAVVASVFMAGCGSNDTATKASETKSSDAASPSPTATTSAEAEAEEPGQSVNEYLEENGITRIHILSDTPDVPQPTVPLPTGWTDMGGDKEKVWGTIALTDTKDSPDPTVILVTYSKFNGPVDPAKILELAPNTATALPEYEGPETGEQTKVSGFDAVHIAGNAVDEGKPVFVSITAVVIPRQDGVYEMLFMAKGPADQEAAITQAMSVMGSETAIQP